ncbi:MAG: GMC family oxidoreductase [Gammaproteobacteria bacterium]|nr:GMC family oxidoreductase [Gammaproteobacteria bacterium]
MSVDDHEVIVVGSGAGGSAAAWALTRAGVRVLLLEAGPAFDPGVDYRLSRPDWETSAFPGKKGSRLPYSAAQFQSLSTEYTHLRSWNVHSGKLNKTGHRQLAGYRHVAGLGGSTLHFTGEAHRMHPAAMKMYSGFQVAADWPLDYGELESSYLEAERIIGVAGPVQDGNRQRSAPCPLPSHPISYASRRLGEGFHRLGMSWLPNNLAVLSQPYNGRPPCNYCGQCRRGCPRTDKGSADVTFLRQARATGKLTTLTASPVAFLEAGADDRITGIRYRDGAGSEYRLSASVIILACGAVNTPRLLLHSEGANAQAGIGNESGQVGRNFMETLGWTSLGLHPDRLDGHRGLPADAICWDYNAPDAITGVVGGCRFTPSLIESDIAGPLNYARRVVGGWGREHLRGMGEQFGHGLGVGAIGEFLPNEDTYVDLDPVHRDEFGMPIARIHSHLTRIDLERLTFMAGKCREIMEAAGVSDLFEEYGSYDFFNSTHVFGTCRMGTDPDKSVVNSECRSHRWKNLYIMDASIFPSSGGGEAPSLTIGALTLRACRRLLNRLS